MAMQVHSKLIQSNSPRAVKFQDLSFSDLRDVFKWIEANVPSMNYAIIADVHVIMEHVHHQINPSKVTLDFLQAIRKLEVPTPNNAVTIQSFDYALPKFFFKAKDHRTSKTDESMFCNIKTC